MKMDNMDILLGEFQEKIIQFIVPALIAASMSAISLFVSTFLTIRGEIIKKRKDTYENMKNFYPEFRTKLVCINAIYTEIANNSIFDRVCREEKFDLSRFVFCEIDDLIEQYNLHEEQDLANNFLVLVKKMIGEIVELNSFFMNQIVPVHNKQAKNLLLALHEYCVFVTWIKNNNEYINVINNRIYNFRNLSILIGKMDKIFHKS